jgi:hypothetical protein
MSWFSKKAKATPPVYFMIGSDQLPTAFDRRTIYQMAFTILITLLEKEGAESFAIIMDTFYIGFSKRGPVVTDLSILQKEQNIVGYAKLSEIPGVMKAKEKVISFGDIITAQNAEMLLQSVFMRAAEEIITKISPEPFLARPK